MYAPSQWEMMLQCSFVSDWLWACKKWSLILYVMCSPCIFLLDMWLLYFQWKSLDRLELLISLSSGFSGILHVDGVLQSCCKFIAKALKSLQSCSKPSIWCIAYCLSCLYLICPWKYSWQFVFWGHIIGKKNYPPPPPPPPPPPKLYHMNKSIHHQ